MITNRDRQTVLRIVKLCNELLAGSEVQFDPESFTQESEAMKILKTVCAHYEITERQIRSQTRVHYIVRPRFVMMYYLRSRLSWSNWQTANFLQWPNGATVSHGVNWVRDQRKFDSEFNLDLNGVGHKLNLVLNKSNHRLSDNLT